MNLEEAKHIIDQEALPRPLIYTSRMTENAVAIRRSGGKWITYATNERAAIEGKTLEFDSESDALENFIKRLRSAKRVFEINKSRAAKRAERERAARDQVPFEKQ